MQLVERGDLDLDAPVTEVPARLQADVQPVRASRSRCAADGATAPACVREPPVGNYFDPDEPSLAAPSQSLNQTELVYAPGRKTKYSNAGVAAVGFVLERDAEAAVRPLPSQTFARPARHEAQQPSSRTPELTKDLAEGGCGPTTAASSRRRRSTLGRPRPADLYTTVNDLGRFLSMLFAGGKAAGGRDRQAGNAGTDVEAAIRQGRATKSGFGLGFMRRRAGRASPRRPRRRDLRLRHGAGRPARRQARRRRRRPRATAPMASRTHIADVALRQMLAVAAGASRCRRSRRRTPLDSRKTRRKLAGRYKCRRQDDRPDRARRPALRLARPPAASASKLRACGDDLIVDDRLAYGQQVRASTATSSMVDNDVYERVAADEAGAGAGRSGPA